MIKRRRKSGKKERMFRKGGQDASLGAIVLAYIDIGDSGAEKLSRINLKKKRFLGVIYKKKESASWVRTG